MADIIHQLLINVPPAKVYQAIVEQNKLAGWWTENVAADSSLGGFAEFRFGEHYYIKTKLIELVPDQLVLWECVAGDDEWLGTHIQFRLEKQEGRTLLKFAQIGWRKMTDFFAHCNYNWGWYLTSLKELCETGKGRPFQER